MVNLVEILFGIAIGSGVVCLLAFIQSKSGGERAIKYRDRMKAACFISVISLGLAVAGELMLHWM